MEGGHPPLAGIQHLHRGAGQAQDHVRGVRQHGFPVIQEETGNHGVGSEQADPRRGDALHQVLHHDRKRGLGAPGRTVHGEAQTLHEHHVAGVEVTAAAVGDRISEPLSHGASRFISGQFQALHVHGKGMPSEFLRQALAPFGEQCADSPPVDYIRYELRDLIDFSKFKAAIPETLLLQFHGEGNGAPKTHGVHAQFVEEMVPFAYFI